MTVPLNSVAASGWSEPAARRHATTAFPTQEAQRTRAGVRDKPTVAVALSTYTVAPFQQGVLCNQPSQIRHQSATRQHNPYSPVHQEATRLQRVPFGIWYQDGARIRGTFAAPQQEADRSKRGQHLSRWQAANGLDVAIRGRNASTGLRDHVLATTFFQPARRPPAGLAPRPGEEQPAYEPSTDLVLSVPVNWSPEVHFVFGVVSESAGSTTRIVSVQRVYIVLNNTALRRVSDNAAVPCTSMSLSLDVTSWTWGFEAAIPGSYQSLVEPTNNGPVTLAAWVNGTEFRVLAENIARERSFGKVGLRVSGRGINAELDAPYAPIQTFRNIEGRTSEQLLDDVLTVNGVPMGYTFDYQPDPWNVPAGAFNFQGTYIGALAAVAQAGGGYLKPHTRDRAFSVQQLYPIAPWEWDTAVPDFVLPSAVVTRESVQWKEMPSYNRVFVSGQDNGVLGQVTRSGTGGTVLAPMVVDSLITSATAARQRGLSILGNTGRQLLHSLRLPVLTTTGVIQPGALVQYEDGGDVRVGMVRSTSVEVGYPDVYQTIGVECHA